MHFLLYLFFSAKVSVSFLFFFRVTRASKKQLHFELKTIFLLQQTIHFCIPSLLEMTVPWWTIDAILGFGGGDVENKPTL
jgi:hypothetical protein